MENEEDIMLGNEKLWKDDKIVREGKMEEEDGGVMFMDEVGELKKKEKIRLFKEMK